MPNTRIKTVKVCHPNIKGAFIIVNEEDAGKFKAWSDKPVRQVKSKDDKPKVDLPKVDLPKVDLPKDDKPKVNPPKHSVKSSSKNSKK